MQLWKALARPAFAGGLLLAAMHHVEAQETLKLAIGQRGNWDTSVSELGQRAGIFKKHGWCSSRCTPRGAARRSRR